MKNFIAAVLLLVNISAFAIDSEHVENTRKAIVTVNARVPVSALGESGGWSGSGFIVDEKLGYILTNQHVVGRSSIGTYFVTFHNGQQTQAKVLFVDQYADFALLKVDPAELPEDHSVVEFSEELPKVNSEVYIVSNNENVGFSFHTGHLADLFDINGDMPQGTYIINLNSAGGSSGSPVLNDDGKAIAIIYGGNKTFAIALKKDYLQYALNSLKQGKKPVRQHIGVMTDLVSLNKAVRHYDFPEDVMKQYIKDFPDARNRALAVHSVIEGSTARGKIQAGDILWKINGKPIGADLAMFDLEMSNSKDQVSLTIFRNGKKMEIKVALYAIREVNQMLDLAGGLFYEADDFSAAKFGIPLGRVMLANVQTGSSFSDIKQSFYQNNRNFYRIEMLEFDGQKINKLSDLTPLVNKAIAKKFININYINRLPYFTSFNNNLVSTHEKLVQDITFDSIDNKPRMLKYDQDKMEWTSVAID